MPPRPRELSRPRDGVWPVGGPADDGESGGAGASAAGREGYARLTRRRAVTLALLAAATLAAFVVDLSVGSSGLTLRQTVSILLGDDSSGTNTAIVWGIRLPATLTCVLVGASLALAGDHMQTILNNPLASPYTLGISSAASFGACLSVVTGFPFSPLPGLNAPLSALAFSLVAALAILAASRSKGTESRTLILLGIMVDFLFTALQALVQYMATQNQLAEIMHWMFGSLSKASWPGVVATAATFAVVGAISARLNWRLTALSLGDDRARSLGIDAGRLRIGAFLMSAALTAVAVSFVGAIGFVGLVAPHLARGLVGEDQRFLAPSACLFGSVLLLCSSVIAKVVAPGVIVPVGIVTDILGVLFLGALIARGRV